LLEPAACVAGGLLVGGVPLRPGQHVAVVGTGTLSLIGVQLLAATKPASLTVVGASPSAIELARHWGATDIVSPDEAATDGWTADADLVFEAGSRPASARLALAAARRGGTVVLEGLPGEPDPDADLSAIPLANLHVQGVFGAQPSAWAAVVELFGAGLLDLAPLVSHRIPLAEVQRAFDLLDNRPRDLRKILLMP
jgi:threonine dehydrogenase-like Zn-dependent dehydrogenase